MTRADWAAAAEHVVRVDPAMAWLVERVGAVRLPRAEPDAFAALSRSIVFQQLAGRAAAAIHGRFAALFPDGRPTAAAVLLMDEATLRGVGLSAAKAVSIRDLATKVKDGTVRLHDVRRRSDDEIVARLSSVRGIGQWTAEMFLIFQLHRPDVWPVDDLGVRRGWQLAHQVSSMPTPKELQAEGDRYRPDRTTAAWYCWQAVHLARGEL